MTLKNGLGKMLITLWIVMMMILSIAHSKGLAPSFKMMYQYLNNFENSKSSGAPKSRTPLAQLIIFWKIIIKIIIFLKNNNMTLKINVFVLQMTLKKKMSLFYKWPWKKNVFVLQMTLKILWVIRPWKWPWMSHTTLRMTLNESWSLFKWPWMSHMTLNESWSLFYKWPWKFYESSDESWSLFQWPWWVICLCSTNDLEKKMYFWT